VAWLGLIETGSILIREKRKHLSKMSDRVSKMFDGIKLIRRKYISISEVISLSYIRKEKLKHNQMIGWQGLQ